jgi:hypothetical protein
VWIVGIVGGIVFRAAFVGTVVVAAAIAAASTASADPMLRLGQNSAGVATPPLPFLDSCPPGTYQAANAGYVQRAAHVLPKSGTHRPWNVWHNYVLDAIDHRLDRIEESMVFGRTATEAVRSA